VNKELPKMAEIAVQVGDRVALGISLHLPQRGTLTPGFFADVVVFHPQRVSDRASYDDPRQFSEGIEAVWVNGVLSYTEIGRGTGAQGGWFLGRGG
jgi:N-acyl-D-amino-acid deacylase